MSSPCSTGSAWAMPSRWLTREPAPEPRAATRTPRSRTSSTTWATVRKYVAKPWWAMMSSSWWSRSQYAGLPVVAQADHAGRGPGGEHPLRGTAPGADQRGLGEADRADAEVVLGVDEAGVGGAAGLGEEPGGTLGPEPGGLGDPLGGTGHGGGVLQPPLAAVQAPARVDRDQPAGGVQDVGGRAGAGVGVADGVGEDGRDALVGGEADGAGGEAERAGAGAAQPVVDGFQAERVAVHLAPRGRGAARPGRGGRLRGRGRRRRRGRAGR